MNISFGMSIWNMRIRPELMLTDMINFSTTKYRFCISSLTTWTNFWNHGAIKRGQIISLANKVTKDRHVLKESSHTTKHKTKVTAHIYINEAQPEYFEEKQKIGEYEESDSYISMKGNLKKQLSLWQNTIKVNVTV